MIVAGEASGDKHGAALAMALRQIKPEITFDLFGSGGNEMRAAGVETLVDARDVGIMGVPEIARAIGKLYRAYRTLLGAARSRRPSVIVLVDWPDFNMRLAKTLHRNGFKVVYYISPQVWAWRKYRIRALRRDVDKMLVILPFEEEFYNRAGLDVQYVGHPLAEAVRVTATREDFCRRHGLEPSRPVFALLPGSRHKEIHYHLPAMLDAAIRLRSFRLPAVDNRSEVDGKPADSEQQPPIGSWQFVIPLASTVRREDVASAIRDAEVASSKKDDNQLSVTVVEGDTYNALGHSEFAVVASGTATVEAALAGTPMVIVYRGSEINWRLIRPLIHLDTFGMVNLIAKRRIVPELMQHDVTGARIAHEVLRLLSDAARLGKMRRDLAEVREKLGAGLNSGADNAARAVVQIIEAEKRN